MKLLDLSGTLIANVTQYLFANDLTEINEDLVRHNCISSIRFVKNIFPEYGKLVIAADSRNCWRKDLFPYYKIKRRKEKEKSTFNWSDLYIFINKIKDEIRDNFPYPVVEVYNAESDDIITKLVENFHDQENILIFSRDHDFYPLQKYKNVKQYSVIDKKFLEVENPEKTLFESIIKGCSSDSIPNIFSPLDSIALGNRQKPAYQKKIDLWWEEGVPEEYQERFEFNKKLVDLSHTPIEIQNKILEIYEKEINKPKKSLINYFMEHNLSQHLQNIQDF